MRLAGLREPGDVALDVGGEHRHAQVGEALGEDLQRHGLAGAGGAGDQAMAVGVLRVDADLAVFVAADKQGQIHRSGLPLGGPGQFSRSVAH